jgi:aspartyl-tRNA(Asn)/glutamyl-tRNA(Gln) amidotransferase subunit C
MIDKTVIIHTARLARIALTDEEITAYGDQIVRILQYIDQLKELEVGAVEPFVHPGKEENVLRKDMAAKPLTTEEALRNAPERVGDYFCTPKVISEE